MKLLRISLACLLFLGASLPAWAERTIAVLDFEDNTPPGISSIGNLDYLHRAMSELLTDSLSRNRDFRLVERLKLRETLDEQKIGSSELADDDGKIRLGKVVGAHAMVFGSFFSIEESIRADVRVVDVATSQILFSDAVTGNANEILGLMTKSAEQIAVKLGGTPSPERSNFPPEVWQDYDSALRLMDAAQYDVCLSSLEALLRRYGSFPPAEHQIVAVLERLAKQ